MNTKASCLADFLLACFTVLAVLGFAMLMITPLAALSNPSTWVMAACAAASVILKPKRQRKSIYSKSF